MQLTVCDGDRIESVDLTDDCSVETLVAVVMRDSHTARFVELLKDGANVLGDDRSKTLAQCGLVNGDLLMYSYKPVSYASSARPAPAPVATAPVSSTTTPSGDGLDEQRKRLTELMGQASQGIKQQKIVERLMTKEQREEAECRQTFESLIDPREQRKWYNISRRVYEQFINNPTDYAGFKAVFMPFMAEERRKVDLMHDPNSAEGQKLLMETMRLQNVQKIYDDVRARYPEGFRATKFLYVKLALNGHPALACIETGAESTIIPVELAKKARLENVMDTRFIRDVDGLAGTVYSCAFDIGGAQFEAKVDVMNERQEVTIGMDFIRRHKCTIDMTNNRLTFNENLYVDFLSGDEIKNFWTVASPAFQVDDDKLRRLVDMGFNDEDVKKALTECANEEKEALDKLFALAAKDAEAIAQVEKASGDGAQDKMEE